ncbi:MAG: hypothetical protein ABRQ38_08300 [Candidatus Eremiobacterota bacterium]
MIEKKIYRILAITLIFSLGLTSVPGLFVPTPAYALNEKLTTAIVSIECPSENDLPVRINSALSAAMVKSHRFEVTDSEQVASTLKDMQLTGKKLNITQACEVGKALGVETVTMVQGYGIQSDNEKCYINLAVQVVDVNTGLVCQSAYATGEGFKGEKFELTDEAINNGCFAVVNQINDNMSKVGLIAIINGGLISLNVGGDMGIKTESEFAVYRENRIIGKLKVKELDSYDCYVEKIAILPGLNFNEGDIVVVSKNQGDELVGDSPSTVPSSSSKPGIILASVIIGTALAIIASNQSTQIQQLAMVYRFQHQFVRHEGNAAVYLVTIQVTDHNGNLLPDGTTVVYKKANSANGAEVKGFGNAMAVQEEVKTFGGIASTLVWTDTGADLSTDPGIYITSEGRDSQVFLMLATDTAMATMGATADPNAHVANGQDLAPITAKITPPATAGVPAGVPVVFQITSGNVTFNNDSKQITVYTSGTTVGVAEEVKAYVKSTQEGPYTVLVQYYDIVTSANGYFGLPTLAVTASPASGAVALARPGATQAVTITVKDNAGKAVKGATINITQGGSTNLGLSTTTGSTLDDGTFTFYMTNNFAAPVAGDTELVEVGTVIVTVTGYTQTVSGANYTVTLTRPAF